MKELLKALAEQDQDLKAPEAVELRLRSAFRKQYARPKWPYFAMAAVAALTTFFVVKTKPTTPPPVVEIAVVKPPAAEVPMAKPFIRKAAHRKSQPREVVTEFFPLIEDAPPFERGELLRVSLPASAMRGVGLPVNEDRLTDMVQADVLVGQEGLARAIRFVRFEY